MRKPENIAASLRTAITKSDKSAYQISKESGVSHPVILRFLSGERDIRLATADKLAAAVGVEVIRK